MKGTGSAGKTHPCFNLLCDYLALYLAGDGRLWLCSPAPSLFSSVGKGICCPAELAGLLLHNEEFLLLWLLVAGWWERGSLAETW